MSTSTDANAAQIAELYQTILGRNPDQGSAEYWDSTGLSVDQIKAELQAARDNPESAESKLFSKIQAVTKDINGLAKDKSIALADIVAYAKDKNIPFDELVKLTEVSFPSLTADKLQFEQDRQTLSKIADDKGAVDLVAAIKAASDANISGANLAKFFGKTPEQFGSFVSQNAQYLADQKLFDAMAPDTIASLTGADVATLGKAKTDAAIYADLSAKKNDQGQVSMTDALAIATKHGLTDDMLAPYIGLKPQDIASYRTNTGIQEKIADAQKSDGKLTLDEILSIQKDTDISLDQFVQNYFGGSDKEKSALKGRLEARDALSPAMRVAQDAIGEMADAKTGQIDLGKLYDYAQANKLDASSLAPLVNMTPENLSSSFNDLQVNRRLQTASQDGLTIDEILGEVDASKMSIDDFVSRYLTSEDKPQLVNTLKNESSFTPEERAIRKDFAQLGTVGMDKALGFANEKGLSDEDAARILGIDQGQIGGYRRNQFVTQGLNAAMGSDNQLDYNEIYQFSKQNNVPVEELINYLGEPDKRDALKTDLQKYIEGVEADARMTPSERLTQQLTQMTAGGSRSGVWDKNSGWDHHLGKMVDYLEGYGIKDLRQIGTKVESRTVSELPEAIQGDDFRQLDEPVQTETDFVVYYDKNTGKELHAVPKSENGGYWEFGSEGQGKGSTGYFIGPTNSGDVGVTSSWREKYGAKEYALPLMFVAAIAAPYLLPEVIGTATGMTAAEAASLGLSANSGLAGILAEAGLSIPAAQSAATVIANGVYKGIAAEMAGGDFNQGFIAGGIAPWAAQYATNWAADNLPVGTNPAIARTVGLAVGQLMSTGEIDPRQLAANALAPQVMDKLVKATNGAITANQAKLLFTTLATGGQNITSMASNPMAVLNFVQQNKGLFDEVLTNKPISEIGKALNISALDDSQQKFFTQDGAIQYPGSRYDGTEFPQVAGELVPGIQRVNDDGSISVGRDKETGLEVRLNPETNELYTTQNVWNEANNQVLMYSSRYKPYDPFDITEDVPAGLITQAKEIKATQPIGLSALLSPSASLNQGQPGASVTPSVPGAVSAAPGATAGTAGAQLGSNATANVLSVSPGTGQVLVSDPSGRPVLLSTSSLSGSQAGSVQPGSQVIYDPNTGKVTGVTAGVKTDQGVPGGITGVSTVPGAANATTNAGVIGGTSNVAGTNLGTVTVPGGVIGGVNTSITGADGNTSISNINVNTRDTITAGVKNDVIDLTEDEDDSVQDSVTTQTTVGGGQTTQTGGQTTVPGGKTTVPGGQNYGFPGMFFPVGGSQTTDYIDYDQPYVGAPVLPEYHGMPYPNYLRPVDIGPFGLQAIIGALNATQQGNGSNQSQQNAAGQGQTAAR